MSEVVTVAETPWILVLVGLLWILVETIASRYVRPRGEESR